MTDTCLKTRRISDLGQDKKISISKNNRVVEVEANPTNSFEKLVNFFSSDIFESVQI